jgi:hypothetical protein
MSKVVWVGRNVETSLVNKGGEIAVDLESCIRFPPYLDDLGWRVWLYHEPVRALWILHKEWILGPEKFWVQREFELGLVSWGEGSGVPNWDWRVAIVGVDNYGLLHIRAFDHVRKCVVDTDETKLPAAQAGAISNFKQQLPGLMPPYMLSSAEKTQVIREVISIVGYDFQTCSIPVPDFINRRYRIVSIEEAAAKFHEARMPLPPELETATPRWDSYSLTLWFGETVCRHYKRWNAENSRVLLKLASA